MEKSPPRSPTPFKFDFNTSNLGKTTITAGVIDNSYRGVADQPYPPNGLESCDAVAAISWKSAEASREAANLFWHQFRIHHSSLTVSGNRTEYELPALNPETTYYWRVDTTQGEFTNPGPIWSFFQKARKRMPRYRLRHGMTIAFFYSKKSKEKSMAFLPGTKLIISVVLCRLGDGKKMKP